MGDVGYSFVFVAHTALFFELSARRTMSRHHPYGGYDEGQGRGRRSRRGGGGRYEARGGHGYASSESGGSYGAYAPSPSFAEHPGMFPPWSTPFPPMPMPMPYGMPPAFPPTFPMYAPGAWGDVSDMHGGGAAMPWGGGHYSRGGRGGPSHERDRRRGGRGSGSRGGGRGGPRPRFTRSVYQPDPNAERPEDNKPCRTLFVRNVAFEVDVQALRADFESFGEIRTWFDIIQRRGMLFVTYYDTRAAEKAKYTMNLKSYVGRALDVHFSLPKDEDQQQHCDREKNQGTLFVVVNDASEPVTEEVFREKFAPFGDIRAIRMYKEQAHTRFVEYWDSRACVAAYDALQETEWLGGQMQLKFAWDLATVSLVHDARTRSEAKAAAEARAKEAPGQAPTAPPTEVAAPWPAYPSSGAPDERLEQAQKVQQVC